MLPDEFLLPISFLVGETASEDGDFRNVVFKSMEFKLGSQVTQEKVQMSDTFSSSNIFDALVRDDGAILLGTGGKQGGV